MSKATVLCSLLVLLQACAVVMHQPLNGASSRSRLTGDPIGGDVSLRQDPVRRSSPILSHGPDDEVEGGTNSGSISGDELGGSSDEYASNDGATSFVPEAEADDAEYAGNLSPRGVVDNGGGAKESSGELGSGGDVECPECGKFFRNDKSMFGHLRSHPNRGYKGATPPEKKLKLLSPDVDHAGSLVPSSSSHDIDGSSGQCSGRDPQLTPFEMFCACVMLTLRCRDTQGGQLDAVDDEHVDVGTGGLITSNVPAQVETEDPAGPEIGNALRCDEHGRSIVETQKKRRRSISKKDGEPNSKKVKLVTTVKEKRPYTCKHCKAEFSTHQALGGHMAGHHREKKVVPALNTTTKEASQVNQDTVGQSQKGEQATGDDESCCGGGMSLLSRRMQVEQLPTASNVGWLPRQASGGHMTLQFVSRNNSTPPVVKPVAADGDRRSKLNFDLNVEAPEQD